MNNIKLINCPLCGDKNHEIFVNDFYLCKCCGGIFKDQSKLLNAAHEQERYELHSDDIFDPGYHKFVSPIINSVIKDFKSSAKGLDFGAGHAPVVTKILKDHGFEMKMYDPYFHKYPQNLDTTYDFITSCEVIEHFYNPKNEFTLLKSMLKDAGILYCMTHLYDNSIDFDKWYYKNDPTHVFIYQYKTIEYIKNHFGFSNFSIDKRLIAFYNSISKN